MTLESGYASAALSLGWGVAEWYSEYRAIIGSGARPREALLYSTRILYLGTPAFLGHSGHIAIEATYILNLSTPTKKIVTKGPGEP